MKIYIASRASIPERSAMWRQLRASGVDINSSWIDEAGEGMTKNFTELWSRIHSEILQCDRLVLYVAPDDFPIKGALVEVGMAIAFCKEVILCAPGCVFTGHSDRPIGSWINHCAVKRIDELRVAMGY